MKNKKTLVSMIFTALGIVNAVLLVVLDCLDKFDANVTSYVLLAVYFVLVWAPQITEKITKTNINFSLAVCYEVFLILALIVGSMWGVYKMHFYYDKFTHLLSGVLVCFAFYNLFGTTRSDAVGAVWLFLLTFLASMAVGGFWEICEFSLDSVLGGDTQRWQGFVGREVLFDTMFDLICDFVGAIAGAVAVVLLDGRKRKISDRNAPRLDKTH